MAKEAEVRPPEETLSLWKREQAQLKALVVDGDTEAWQRDAAFSGLRRVGGVDVSFVKGDSVRACASLVVLSYPELEVVYEDCCMVSLTAPYVSGFLAFREVPFLVDAVRRLREKEPCLVPQAGTSTPGRRASVSTQEGRPGPATLPATRGDLGTPWKGGTLTLRRGLRFPKKPPSPQTWPPARLAPGCPGLMGEGQFGRLTCTYGSSRSSLWMEMGFSTTEASEWPATLASSQTCPASGWPRSSCRWTGWRTTPSTRRRYDFYRLEETHFLWP
ncbi:endonuclease V isoform X3 [Enhydra lutris kenyoni]|uniref:Endonuclease V isoform X3 n=1 Tax=Enhydra lutris kenyoni TaxID=391180 RepID=A0A2Y9L063_ENHLU|nr:endonuclease V isoform X3 [Enhydra lutris kenyoni]